MTTRTRTILSTPLIALLALVIIGCGGPKVTCDMVAQGIAQADNKAIKPVPRGDKWWTERHQGVLDQVKKGDCELLFIGDSITHGWDGQAKLWGDSFGKWKPINAGYGGDRTEHVLWRLENGEIEGIKPKVAVIMIGTNNSNGDEYTAEQIGQGIQAIVCSLRTKLPETKVLILAIFPRGSREQMADKSQDASPNPQWAKNDAATAIAAQMADGKMIHFLDINPKFLNEQGIMTRDIMPDLLHPRDKGYQIWADAMLPTLDKLMK